MGDAYRIAGQTSGCLGLAYRVAQPGDYVERMVSARGHSDAIGSGRYLGGEKSGPMGEGSGRRSLSARKA